ncbi:integral membrane protein [Mycolicibacterium aurum]|uniref:Integral membrane protein n=1 Tax=Mycolicibacterium aurum TaxID=1791 RepID=A0A3S4RP61_MYCAU|nr:membrane protein [Mycolicibacterium aurum]VEG55365.1 integral membrane protein [Mycolicibacterium aurum]
MGRHHTPDLAGIRNRSAIRTTVLALAGLTVFVIAMVASYSGAFAKPALHHMTVAVAAPQQIVDGLRDQNALSVNAVGDAAAARAQVYERTADTAFAVTPDRQMTIYVAGGGGHSVAAAAEVVGRATAERAGLTPTVEDVAPTSAGDPSGTVEFYAVIFISIGASLGAALLGRLMGTVRTPSTLALRTVSLAVFSAVLAGVVTVYVGPVLDALTGHPLQVFAVLWLYAMAVGGAVTGVAAAFGTLASVLLGLFLVVVGNAAAAGPVGRPLLSGFYSTFSTIVPQGSGVSLLRSISYFDGHGAVTPLVTLAIWAAAGCCLAVLATAARVNYRALYERRAGGYRALLRPRLLPSAD